MKTGQRIRYVGHYGGMDAIDGFRFVGDVHPGDTGIFLSKHANPKLKDWLWTKADGPVPLFVPVHPAHIELIAHAERIEEEEKKEKSHSSITEGVSSE